MKFLPVLFYLPFASHAQKNDSTQLIKPVAFDWNIINAVPTKTGE